MWKWIVLALAGLTPETVLGDIVTYTVDPTRSILTASGTYAGETLGPQLTQSIDDNQIIFNGFIISYGGNIIADRNILANTLQITGGTVSAQSSYAVSAASSDDPTSAFFLGDISDFSFSPLSDLITSPANFDASKIYSQISSGQLNFSLLNSPPNTIPTSFSGSLPVGGNLPFASGVASLVDADGSETLTVPVDTEFTTDVDGSLLVLNLSGDIVATLVVPEPGALAIISIPALFLETVPPVVEG
jgi:hypothetical protein